MKNISDDSNHAVGVCPSCGYGLDYPEPIHLVFENDGGYIPCKCPKCGFEGKENYSLEFVNFTE